MMECRLCKKIIQDENELLFMNHDVAFYVNGKPILKRQCRDCTARKWADRKLMEISENR